MKTVLYIDGRNFIGKMKEVFRVEGIPEDQISNYPWVSYNFRGLLDQVLTGINIDERYFYLGRLKVHQDTKKKSEALIQEQRLLKTHLEQQGFTVILAGNVRGNWTEDAKGKRTLIFKEKGVDVSIAVDMVSQAYDGLLKTAILGSSDSDMQPAIKALGKKNVERIYLGFELQPNKGLTATNQRTILIRNAEAMAFAKLLAS